MKEILNGRFSILETVTENRLYKAVDTATGKMTAVKKWVNEDSYYKAELKALKNFKHLDIPQFICNFEEEGEKYIAEEWLDGAPPLQFSTPEETIDLAVKLAEFVSVLTSSFSYIHGDIKPSNIIVQNGKVYFMDFECSVALDVKRRENLQETIKITGKYFTAPEVFYGNQCLQSDIYSIGAIMAWMLGGVDDNGINLSNVAADGSLKAIIKKCTAYRAENRYKTAEELIYALKEIKNNVELNIIPEKISHPGERFSVYIDCNVFFAWELAEVATTYFGMKTCVMAVSQRTQKKLNYFADLNRNYGTQSVEEEISPYFLSSESLFKKDCEKWLSKGLINKTSDGEGKLFYSGSRFIGEAEPENEGYISDLVKWGKENFDCVIFVTDRYDDKPAVKNLACECDYTIATPLANIDDIEACKDYYESLGGNVLYSVWEYNQQSSLPEKSIMLMVGEEKYIGAIFYSDKKNYKRNFAGKIQPIFKTKGREEQAGYVKIINRLFRAAGNSEERCVCK